MQLLHILIVLIQIELPSIPNPPSPLRNETTSLGGHFDKSLAKPALANMRLHGIFENSLLFYQMLFTIFTKKSFVGTVHHLTGTLCTNPNKSDKPKFAQIYIHDSSTAAPAAAVAAPKKAKKAASTRSQKLSSPRPPPPPNRKLPRNQRLPRSQRPPPPRRPLLLLRPRQPTKSNCFCIQIESLFFCFF